MRTVSCIVGGDFTGKIWALRQQGPLYEQLLRRLSTNSAINRGIRRGKSSSFRGEGRSQVDRGGRSGGQSSNFRRGGGLQIDHSERSGRENNHSSGSDRSQIYHGDRSRAKSDLPRRHGQSQAESGGRLRGTSFAIRGEDRFKSQHSQRSGWKSSFSGRDSRSPINHGDRQGGDGTFPKKSYRGEVDPWSRTGSKSMSQNHPEIQSRTGQDSPESSRYTNEKDLVQEAGKSHIWMGRGSVASRAASRKKQSSPEDDDTLEGKPRTNNPSLRTSRTGNDVYPMRHYGNEESRAGHRSHRYLNLDDSHEDEALADSKASLRNRQPTLSIPYTTPASEFLYGTSVVTSALRSKRRKLYKLYVHDGSGPEGLASHEATDRLAVARKLAVAAGVELVPVKSGLLPLMDKMSDGRPHNGYVLEASPLPKLPVVSLQAIKAPQSTFEVTLGHQSFEDEAINGLGSTIQSMGETERFPFVLLLDGILDPGNLGAILRTAYFLGADAVAISTHQSAPLTPVALKASAGASENITLFSVSNVEGFVQESSKNGWQIYAATAPRPGTSARKGHLLSTSTLNNPLDKSPAVLMLGGEGEGLRYRLQKQADHCVGIGGARAGLGGVDSLNVSVACALLTDAFLRPYTITGRTTTESSRSPEERLF